MMVKKQVENERESKGEMSKVQKQMWHKRKIDTIWLDETMYD